MQGAVMALVCGLMASGLMVGMIGTVSMRQYRMNQEQALSDTLRHSASRLMNDSSLEVDDVQDDADQWFSSLGGKGDLVVRVYARDPLVMRAAIQDTDVYGNNHLWIRTVIGDDVNGL